MWCSDRICSVASVSKFFAILIAAAMLCCAAMCSAVAVPKPRFAGERIFPRLPATPLAASVYHGVLSEIATPPPRRA